MLILFSKKSTITADANLPALSLSAYTGSFIAASLRAPSIEFAATYYLPQDMDATFPSLDIGMEAGSHLDEIIPSFSCSIEATGGQVMSFVSELPGFDMEAFLAGYVAVDLPMLTQTILATPTVLANIEASLPAVSSLGFLSLSSEGDIEAAFPPLRMDTEILTGAVVSITASILPLYMSGILLPGQVVNMDEHLPKLKAAITSIRTGPTSIVATLPSIRALAQSGEIESNVLRYVKEKVR